MCRYGMTTYKPHYACFECRKTFKQSIFTQWVRARFSGSDINSWFSGFMSDDEKIRYRQKMEQLQQEYYSSVRQCPECKNPMANMGMDFRAPKQSNTKAWAAALGAYRMGHAFQTCGCNGPGFIPSNQVEYREYLLQRRTGYQRQLKEFEKDSEIEHAERVQRCQQWSNLIKMIDQELQKTS